ncbi:hydrolase [Corynebacterium yudongzhengii]|uniref:Hydrolase n=1 Tax=Corynebacterium yudongzhengii TaxID=2080740 RepID=A0A2U1T7A0_9CORY|nr:NlpC/P60 family protein [Corynebacterium yudongzhengii]AWB81549.1 hydrolase [Corynebacterium yudongzhengii]PWC01880.1 hydrolase [Corynebacterium yudongzhengii]
MRSPSFSGKMAGTSLIACLTVGGTLTAVPVAGADDTEVLFTQLEEISREASAKNEEVLALEVEIDKTEDAIAESEARVAESQEEIDKSQEAVDAAESESTDASKAAEEADRLAREARSAQEAVRDELDNLAGARYRGVYIDPLTNAVSASDPAAMVDRVSYMSLLADDATAHLQDLEEENRRTAQAASQAHAAVAEANWSQSVVDRAHEDLSAAHEDLKNEQASLEEHRAALEEQRASLEVEQADLETQISDVQSRVDGLSPADLDRWQNRFGSSEIAPSSVSSDGVVGAAMSQIGKPYGWGATGPNAYDCSGLMYWAFQQQGKTIPRTSAAQVSGGQPVSRGELQPGDIVGFYPGVTHVGMYIGNGQVVHASDYGTPVGVASLDSMPFAGAARY